jgi:hypothetical protein
MAGLLGLTCKDLPMESSSSLESPELDKSVFTLRLLLLPQPEPSLQTTQSRCFNARDV